MPSPPINPRRNSFTNCPNDSIAVSTVTRLRLDINLATLTSRSRRTFVLLRPGVWLRTELRSMVLNSLNGMEGQGPLVMDEEPTWLSRNTHKCGDYWTQWIGSAAQNDTISRPLDASPYSLRSPIRTNPKHRACIDFESD